MDLKYFFILILIIPYVSGSIRINEVYAESIGRYEWVELYNFGSSDANLTNWEFGDSSNNDIIKGDLILKPNNYALLTSEASSVGFLWDIGECNILYAEGALGLNDGGDNIYLYNSSDDIIDSLSYPDLNDNKIYALNESGECM